MPENEFEKNVQQKMGDLKMLPSGAVWQSVEEALKKKKRRRVVVIIFLLAGIGLAGWYSSSLFTGNSSYKITKGDSLLHYENDQTILLNDSIKRSSINSNSSGDNNKYKEPEINMSSNGEQGKVNERENKMPERETSRMRKKTVENRSVTSNKEVKETPVPEIDKKKDNTPDPGKTSVVKNDREAGISDQKEEGNITVRSSDVSANQIKQNDNLKEKFSGTDSITATDSIIAKTDSSDKKEEVIVKKKRSNSKIKWGFDVSVGRASSRNDIFSFSFDENKAERDMSGYSNSPSNGGASGNSIRPPSDINGGPAFKIGLTAEIKLTQRSSLYSGFRYSYLSEKIKVSSRVDTTILIRNYYSNSFFSPVTGIYNSTTSKKYTNSYHFIEIPLGYQLQLNKGKRTSWLWNTGISASYLISTNSLVYDTSANGIYYRNKKAFNRFHFNLTTGFSLRFGDAKKIQWAIGPDISFDMTPLMKQEVFTEKRFLLYGGITGRLFFSSKKK